MASVEILIAIYSDVELGKLQPDYRSMKKEIYLFPCKQSTYSFI
jgi:hypothetical protein